MCVSCKPMHAPTKKQARTSGAAAAASASAFCWATSAVAACRPSVLLAVLPMVKVCLCGCCLLPHARALCLKEEGDALSLNCCARLCGSRNAHARSIS